MQKRKPSAKRVRQQKAAHAVAQRTSRPVDVCTWCLDAVIGPALRTAERRLPQGVLYTKPLRVGRSEPFILFLELQSTI